jgi:hypothetical protein
VLKEILKILLYAWTKEKIPLIVTLQSIKDNERRKEYTEKRDLWNIDRDGEVRNVWKNTTIEHGGAICRAKGVKNKVIATKILYDWVEHGRNRAKREIEINDKELATIRRECGEIDSQFHILTECITEKLTSIRMETDARIDLYIKGIEEKGENIYFHNCIKEMVHGSIRTDKLRLGLWEIRDADEVANIELVKKASEVELNKLRNELGNLNAIYFMGCRKLIREKQKMDWRDRNPNTIGKKKNRINSKKNRKNECFSGKNRSVNEVLKTLMTSLKPR